MRKMIFPGLIYAASAAIIIAFFMPWATVATSVTGVSKGLTGALAKTPYASKIVGELDKVTDAIGAIGDISIKSTVSGYQVPVLVNNETSKVAISLAQTFFKGAKDLDKKSYLVYLLPILGIVCALFAFWGRENKFYIVLMALLSGAVGIGGLYKLYTMNVSSQMVKISIQDGLWYTMYSLLFICIVGIIWLKSESKKS